MNLLEVRNLVKHYPGVVAVDGISFSIGPGICFGLLGPNGAGKTTAIEIIEGILSPTSGEILYKGSPRSAAFREEVGIQLQTTAVFEFLSVRETLETFRKLYRNPMPMAELIRLCHLEDILERYNNKISGGQKQRLMLAMALANDPELVFLDEPTTGLDPQARRYLWNIVRQIKAKGKTVVLTTHNMDEAQMLCDEIIIIDVGKIIAQGSPSDLLKSYCSGVTITLPIESFPELPEKLFRDGTSGCGKWKRLESQGCYEFQTADINNCLDLLLKAGTDLSQMSVRSQNLEDLFLQLTGRKLRD
ncbi:MAG: ABC transporter ATP-binding protein [Desulfobacteraceae bacterium IS3]|nr:MAG: ABC transporter ATP-binding protein [Desulfobacteraceae bacterium IS3]